MSPIIPLADDAIPAATGTLLGGIKKQMGMLPNFFRVLANSPAALKGHLGLSGSLGGGTLDRKTRERIALAMAEFNGCDYCLSVHTDLARHVARLDDSEITANRNGASNDIKADAAVRFAVAVARERGHVGKAQLDALIEAGYGAGQVIEIVQHVALNTFTNYLNEIAATPIDFPVVRSGTATAAAARA